MATNTSAEEAASVTTSCPNCGRLQHAADRRWVELQNLRARLLAFEGVISEYLWLVSEAAAKELDQEAWQERLDHAKERALELLNVRPAPDSAVSQPEFSPALRP